MNMLLSLSVCSALLMWTCSGNTDSDESPTDYDTTTLYYDYDYDYNVTLEYTDYDSVNASIQTKADNERSLSPPSNEAFGTEELSRVLILGLAVLQIWI